MILDATCKILYQAQAAVPTIMMLRPRSGPGQWVEREEYLLNPKVPVIEYTDRFGNLCQRVVFPPGACEVFCSCRVHASDVIDVRNDAPMVLVNLLPQEVLEFLLPSRYCQSDMLGQEAGEIVGMALQGYSQVAAIEQWLRNNLTYTSGSSNQSTSALDTLREKVGVCRDYAHLGMALTRALEIPARMVVGYLLNLYPMDLHAWFEAYVGDQWFTFDGTQPGPCGNRIVIGYGRDAADVALASNYGPLEIQSMNVTVNLAVL